MNPVQDRVYKMFNFSAIFFVPANTLLVYIAAPISDPCVESVDMYNITKVNYSELSESRSKRIAGRQLCADRKMD